MAGQDALEEQFKPGLAQTAYYSVGRQWEDYAPAYRFGRDSRERYAGRRFEDMERELETQWPKARASSRLGWVEARGAIEDAWSLAPGDDVDVALDSPGPKVG